MAYKCPNDPKKQYHNKHCKERQRTPWMKATCSDLNQAEDEKKAINSDLKSRIDGLQATVNGSATKLNNGYEMRTIKCEVVPDYESKVFRYIRTDTHEIAKERRMSSDDLQMELAPA